MRGRARTRKKEGMGSRTSTSGIAGTEEALDSVGEGTGENRPRNDRDSAKPRIVRHCSPEASLVPRHPFCREEEKVARPRHPLFEHEVWARFLEVTLQNSTVLPRNLAPARAGMDSEAQEPTDEIQLIKIEPEQLIEAQSRHQQ